ncbi:MAG TPA: hypothetical protein PKA63_08515 [Oligoflexia bacterium]|nr:hypothetical protein [Oligoflexia bacterium]HMP48693.1 hypothetical protein [Oligoflexia bacterium]
MNTLSQHDTELSKLINRFSSLNSFGLIIIDDYKPGDPAQIKDSAAILYHLPKGVILSHGSVRELDTQEMGFTVAMLAGQPMNNLSADTIFYVNCAPIYKEGERNGHHNLCIALLLNGRVLISPNSGETFSYLHCLGLIKNMWIIHCEQDKKQFRSWCVFPEVIGRLFAGVDVQTREVDPSKIIPKVSDRERVFTDNLGNVRFFLSLNDLPSYDEGDKLFILRNGVPVAKAVLGEQNEVPDVDELSFRHGSNIIESRSGNISFLDLFRVGGRADRSIVLERSFCPFFNAFRVGDRAFRTVGLLAATKGFLLELWIGVSEWYLDTPEYLRKKPRITFRRR